MTKKIIRLLFPILITITLFSLWAGFALLIINKYFYKNLSGYVIGRLCIWELVALTFSTIIAKLIISKWGNISTKVINNKKHLIMDSRYGIYFGVYFLIAIIIAIWQFWIFSQKF